jgi:hypothetical protein
MKSLSMKLVLVVMSVSLVIGSAFPQADEGMFHGDPPYLLEEGWKPLLNGVDLDGWQYRNPERGGWGTTAGVFWGGTENPSQLSGRPGPGDRIINTMTNFKPVPSDLFTVEKFGDVELYLEFMVSDRSNSGVYLHGLYEVQIWDSYGRDQEHIQDICGTIYDYERRVNNQYVGAVAPCERAERPTGRWQSFHIWFQAPRFGADGKKTANAKFLRVLHNGVLINENVERAEPTRACMNLAEAPRNPLMLQGDHGPVAFRNIHVRPLSESAVISDGRGALEALEEIREPDVIFVPTPQEVVEKMLELAQVKKGDLIYDLGCGDGRIVVTAAKKYGCKGVGYDIDPQRVRESLENVEKNKIGHLVHIEQKDIFTLDLSQANVITLYLLPSLNVKLIPQLEKLKPGSRIVSHDFDMKGVKPDQVVTVTTDHDDFYQNDYGSNHTVYLWTTPLQKEETEEQ